MTATMGSGGACPNHGVYDGLRCPRCATAGSPLDRIEDVLEGWCDSDWMPTWKDDKFIPQLLALVNVAKAAEPMAKLPAPITADERQEWIIRQNALREALAVLHKEPA